MAVVPLPPPPPPASLAGLMDDLAGEVAAGNVASLAVAYVDREGRMNTVWTEARPAGSLLGAIALLQHQYNATAL